MRSGQKDWDKLRVRDGVRVIGLGFGLGLGIGLSWDWSKQEYRRMPRVGVLHRYPVLVLEAKREAYSSGSGELLLVLGFCFPNPRNNMRTLLSSSFEILTLYYNAQ